MINIFWFRRDLRLKDNAGLYHLLNMGEPVLGIFIFDEEILSELREQNASDRRLSFIHKALSQLDFQLQQRGSRLMVLHGFPEVCWRQLLNKYEVGSVAVNRDYEPYACRRDEAIERLLQEREVTFNSYRDQVIFEQAEIVKDDGTPYVVFTPYSRKWKQHLLPASYQPFPSETNGHWLVIENTEPLLSLDSIGFSGSNIPVISVKTDKERLQRYGLRRDFPAVDGTSRVGPHLRFGTISIRSLVKRAVELKAETYLNELIWREFYMMILWHFPKVVHAAFRPAYDAIPWRNHRQDFEKWCEGMTGYPLVDAGMRELKASGYMHNRVRMVTASFLTKHLLIDWRWGEAWFARHLMDFELASNNGGWQWAAGSGCDAAPYFRVFNPTLQMKKFDRDGAYVRRWIPEYGTSGYPEPIVDHKFARRRAIDTYKTALNH